MDFERRAQVAKLRVHQTGSRPFAAFRALLPLRTKGSASGLPFLHFLGSTEVVPKIRYLLKLAPLRLRANFPDKIKYLLKGPPAYCVQLPGHTVSALRN